ncbi:MAG: LPS export ABC transporter permease LptG [bacterium]
MITPSVNSMKILDRYILRRFIMILGFALLTFLLIFIIVDLIGNLDKFIDKKVPKLIILEYYAFYIPFILVLVLPVAMLLASLFSMGQMARYNELTAIKSVGISLNIILLPLLIFSIFVSLSALIFGEKIVPPANQSRTNIKNEYMDSINKRIHTKITNIFLREKDNRRIFIGYYDSHDKTAHKVSVQKYNDNQIVERVDAPKMKWEDSTWVLLNGYRRSFSGVNEKASPFKILRDSSFDFNPEQLAESQKAPEDMSYGELETFIREVIRNGGNPNRWLVDLHLKISIPFANFIMVLFGAPLASNKKRSGAIVGFIVSLVICFFYFGFVKFTQTLGHNGGLSPWLAAWLANGFFLISGIILLAFSHK